MEPNFSQQIKESNLLIPTVHQSPSSIFSPITFNTASWLHWEWLALVNSVVRYQLTRAPLAPSDPLNFSSSIIRPHRFSLFVASHFTCPIYFFLSELFFTFLTWLPWFFVIAALMEYISLGGALFLCVCSLVIFILHSLTPTRFHVPLVLAAVLIDHSASQLEMLTNKKKNKTEQ